MEPYIISVCYYIRSLFAPLLVLSSRFLPGFSFLTDAAFLLDVLSLAMVLTNTSVAI